MTIAAATKPIDIRVSISCVPGEWGAKARPSYTRALMRSSSRSSPALRLALRAGAAGAVGAAVAIPLLRRRARIPVPVTIAACAGGPLALAVLRPRSPRRDVALFAMQMWAFTMIHEIPYDDPERLRNRLRTLYPIAIDRAIGLGSLPDVRLQRGLAGVRGVGTLNRFLTWVHWLWFFEPYAALLFILVRHPARFPRAARRLAAVFDVGCVAYFAAPTAPPWWSSREGLTGEPVRRIMEEVGKDFWGGAWPRMYGALGGNPWAAMPSLHFATALVAADSLGEAGRTPGAVGWGYALTLGFALVYLGEHYVTDLAAGTALVVAVRRAEPLVEPLVLGVNQGLQRLERIANG
jgi:membrane-associated phospholipid phosphatase